MHRLEEFPLKTLERPSPQDLSPPGRLFKSVQECESGPRLGSPAGRDRTRKPFPCLHGWRELPGSMARAPAVLVSSPGTPAEG